MADEVTILERLPSLSRLTEKAYAVIEAELNRLRTKSINPGLTPAEVRQFISLVKGLTDLSKEERELLAQAKKSLTEDQLLELVKKLMAASHPAKELSNGSVLEVQKEPEAK